jgi:hypothetical protein
MNKKAYQQPRLHTVEIHIDSLLQNASPVERLESGGVLNSEIKPGSGPARGRYYESDWDED